jgi:predicted phage tail protein
MLVKFYGELDKYEPINLEVTDIRQVIAGVKHTHGNEISELLLQNEYKYILCNSQNLEDMVALHPGLVSMNFGHYDSLLIIPNVEGQTGVEIMLFFGASAAFMASTAGMLAAFAINMVLAAAISIAVGALMQLLSPTPSFTRDPASTQASANKLESNLFNGAPNIREQGGSVPLIYGTPMCGGVLISAGISTEEATI